MGENLPSGLNGNEHLHPLIQGLKNDTVLDFWQWAFSNLQANDVRGIFAEWLIAKLLDIPLNVRDSWIEWDLMTSEGVKIEVKTSAYLQTWSQKRPSQIVFTGLKGRKLDSETNQYAREATYNADIYVFCVQIEQDPNKWDALDLEQWRFYLLLKEQIERLNQKSLSLKPLTKISQEMTADEFRQEAIKLISSLTIA
ncbi:MAG: hypothetical protein GY797_06990 [Deltaproteobacteria bacterium]|nr:hypothetical protein [Deltaproteobacteria bacterium]